MNNNIEEEKIIYRMMEYRYLKENGRQISSDPQINADLYPSDWYSNDDYLTKAEILGEAIEKKVLINQTEKYKQIQEGIR